MVAWFPTAARTLRHRMTRSTEHVVVFGAEPEPGAHLARIFEWALSCERAPLPFFPKSSLAFAKPALEHKAEQAWRAAQQAYHGGDTGRFRTPEAEENLEQARLWEGISPLESTADSVLLFRFDRIATEFFEPMFAARKAHPE